MTGAGKAFLKNQEEIGDMIEENEKELAKLGITIGQVDFSSFGDSGDDIVEASRRIRAQENTIRGNISALEESLKKEKSKEEQNEALIGSIENKIKVEKANLALTSKSANAASEFVVQLLRQGDASAEATVNTDELANATRRFIKETDVQALNAQTEAIRKYGKEANSAELLAAANIGITAAAVDKKIELYETEIQKLNEKDKVEGQLNDKDKARRIELTGLIAQESNKQAQLEIDAQNAVIQAFEAGVDRVNQKVKVVGETASSLKGSFDKTTSVFVSGLQAATGLIDTIVQREISGLEVGDRKRKEIIRRQLKAQAKAIEVEGVLNAMKLKMQTSLEKSEARIRQGQLQVLAAQARMQGNAGLAEDLMAQAQAQDQLIQDIGVRAALEKKMLDFNEKQKEQALIQKGLEEEIGTSAKSVADQLGVQVVSLDEGVDQLEDFKAQAVEVAQQMFYAADNAQQLKQETAETAMEQGVQDAKDARDALGEASEAADGLGMVMDGVNGSFLNVLGTGNQIVTVLKRAKTAAEELIQITGGTPARAMGGPVTGGQQYTVNDGGGREAFLSNTGKFSMLPAARNIQWTAPSSGTIISAKVLKVMQRNQRHDAAINNAQINKNPTPKLMAATAMTSDSGSLAKQITTAMSGSTSNRITNNVTIQSQSPVNDASDLMTNVARMRLRNSRRF